METKEEFLEHMILGSNLGHIIEGTVILIISIFIFGEVVKKLQKGPIRLTVPILLILQGVLATILLFHTHNVEGQIIYTYDDPQQVQHGLIGYLLCLTGFIELLKRLEKLTHPIWNSALPLSVLIIGILFFIHTQHGTHEAMTKSVLIHQILGTTLIIAGIFGGLQFILARQVKSFKILFAIFLLLASIQLIIYREPEGAFEIDNYLEQSHEFIEHKH